MSAVRNKPAPGSIFKFTVRSADEAATAIREKLGENAKVISVRQIGGGLGGLFGRSQLEVIAQVPAAEAAPVPEVRGFAEISDAPAAPVATESAAKSGSQSARTARGSASLPELLRRGGFSEHLVARLQTSPDWAAFADRPLNQSLVGVASALRRQHENRRSKPLPSKVAFIGSPGAGRTTALCKWLGLDVFQRNRAGLVAKVEFDRPNPAEPLAVFCEALGISIVNATDSLPSAPDNCVLYADLPAISIRNRAENRALKAFLDKEGVAGRVLVLNAAYDVATLREGYVVGRDIGATHVVFTHLDEISQWGKLWDFLVDGELSPLFLSTGPSLTGDCEEDVITALLNRTLPAA